MKNIEVRAYISNDIIKSYFPNSKIVYTINNYTSGKIWDDNYMSAAIKFRIDPEQYVCYMKGKFNCHIIGCKLFFESKKVCEDAIAFIEVIKIMSKLTKQ